MKRAGKKGEGVFKRISWNEALDTVAEQLKKVKQHNGCPSILYIGYSGNTGTFLHSQLAAYRLLSMFGGFTPVWGSASFWGSLVSSEATFGTITTGHTRDDLLHARLIIMWGWNPAEAIQITNTSLYLAQARMRSTSPSGRRWCQLLHQSLQKDRRPLLRKLSFPHGK